MKRLFESHMIIAKQKEKHFFLRMDDGEQKMRMTPKIFRLKLR